VNGAHETERRGRDRVATPRILVVDDSAAMRRILARALEAAGYRVSEAEDGQAALAACRAAAPDLVLLDIDMPVMDGPTALKEMKADEDLLDIPVLFLTARTSGSDLAAGLELGAQDYLRKPCEPAELTARVAAALRERVLKAALRERALEANRLSSVDTLTGVGNRRRFEMRTEEMLATMDGATAVGLMVIDVDHFKRINDSEGHPVGDAVLQIVAGRLGNAIGVAHLLVRWGGEEFLVLTTRLPEAALVELAERLRRAISDQPFAIDEQHTIDVTASIGCASGRLDALDSAIAAADKALYEAKRAGRNRVATASRYFPLK
jgi:two-component system cell cycle response regulator